MNKQELNEKIFDDMLSYALEESADDPASSLPPDEELEKEVTLRPEFEARMAHFFRRQKQKERSRRSGRVLLKAACFLCIIIVVSTAVIFSVEALRVPFLNFFSNSGNDSTTVHVEDAGAEYDAYADQVKGLYLPSYIPDTYSVASVERTSNYYRAIYKSADENMIVLQSLLNGSSAGIDNTGSIIERLTINDEEAQFFTKDQSNILIFKYKQNAMMLSAKISKIELVKIAESIIYFS